MKGDDVTEKSAGDSPSRAALSVDDDVSRESVPSEEDTTAARYSTPASTPASISFARPSFRPGPKNPVAAEEPPSTDPGRAAASNSTSGETDEEDVDSFTHEGLPEFEHDDPLAPAFDIEKGTPLGEHRNQLPVRADIKSAKEFFNSEILYRFDILEDETRAHLTGRYRIELKGFQGGIWTILVGDTLDIVNRREDAEIVFTMQQRDFLQLVNGELNPQLAMFAQKMRVSGDMKKAVAFQVLLAPEVD